MDRIQVLGPPRIEALSSERVNFASAQNAVPVIQKLRVINKGAQDIGTVRLSLGTVKLTGMHSFSTRNQF